MSRSGIPKGVEEDSSESNYWYVMAEDKQIGPMTFSRLRQMARQGTLSSDTQVRTGESGKWVNAGSLANVSFGAAPATAPVTVQDSLIPQPPGIMTNIATSLRDRTQMFCRGVMQGIADQLSAVRTIVSWIALVGIVVGLVVILIRNFPQLWFMAADPQETYTTLWEELKEKRTSKASSSDWDDFAARAEHELAPIIVRLEHTASADNRVAQQLLWAGRDYFPKMLHDARSDVSESEKKFDYHLVRAQWLTEGRDLDGKPANRPFLYGSTYDISTILLVAFVIVDVGIVVWFVGRWFRNRNST